MIMHHRPDDALTSRWSWVLGGQDSQAGWVGQHLTGLHQFFFMLLIILLK